MVNDIALASLRKWESEIQFMNLIRQIHERGQLYKTSYGNEPFYEMVDKIQSEPSNESTVALIITVLIMASVMLGLMLGTILVS